MFVHFFFFLFNEEIGCLGFFVSVLSVNGMAISFQGWQLEKIGDKNVCYVYKGRREVKLFWEKGFRFNYWPLMKVEVIICSQMLQL